MERLILASRGRAPALVASTRRWRKRGNHMSYLAMPHKNGYIVMYSEMRTFPARNGRPEYSKEVNDCCCFPTKEEADAKAESLKAKGCKIRGISECIY